MDLDIFQFDDYREILRQEYFVRTRRNGRYSLRSFARDLKLSPSRLSEVLNEKANLSRKNAQLIAERLSYNDSEMEMFCALAEACNPKSPVFRQSGRLRVVKCRKENLYKKLNVDRFQIIADWYHLALLELTRLASFQHSRRWIAKALQITELQVNEAIDRLKRLGLLAEDAGQLRSTVSHMATKSGEYPSKAIIKAHEQFLNKANEALHTTELLEREFGSLILSINTEKMEEAKTLIREFRRDFNRRMDATSVKNRVYCLSMQFFPINKEVVDV